MPNEELPQTTKKGTPYMLSRLTSETVLCPIERAKKKTFFSGQSGDCFRLGLGKLNKVDFKEQSVVNGSFHTQTSTNEFCDSLGSSV